MSLGGWALITVGWVVGGCIGYILGWLHGHTAGIDVGKERQQTEHEAGEKIKQMYRADTVKKSLTDAKADHDSPNHVCTRFCPGNSGFDWFN